jgi:5,10-methenyltetrahydromethanopterin hydrogenase
MSESYGLAGRIEQLYVDDIQFDEQGNTIYDEFEQKERNSEHWQDNEKNTA